VCIRLLTFLQYDAEEFITQIGDCPTKLRGYFGEKLSLMVRTEDERRELVALPGIEPGFED